MDFLLWLQGLRDASGGVFDGIMMSFSSIVTGVTLYLFIGGV